MEPINNINDVTYTVILIPSYVTEYFTFKKNRDKIKNKVGKLNSMEVKSWKQSLE